MLTVFVAAPATPDFAKGGENPHRARRIQFLTSVTAKINHPGRSLFP
jgi:hypothetical protein